ncbi:PREDICTED: uncharacterized protein LOC108359847 [Rhagoletis zephyria]|uniref:uncharacterized protein LOC108359847 n=1 Tax=Rhagoletis zephyria TaxID=28612 RepID=UPI0008113C38|nr:PREDICTED: uncharacterized protein LOC108359847 [Rhagoletis zephyria]
MEQTILMLTSWVEQFEESAETVGWTEVHKFIYAKQLLRGAAKSFVRSQVGLKDWNKLKAALIAEFGVSLCSAEVHRILRNRQKKYSETFLEFLYALMEIGKKIHLDEASLLDYFVAGIPDTRFNKTVLYQAKSIKELKEQIKIYEKISTKPKSTALDFKPKSEKVDKDKAQAGERKCFKCGDASHVAKDCTLKDQQVKCFKCSKMGHKSYKCPGENVKVKSEKTNLNTVKEIKWKPSRADRDLRFKKLKVGNTIFPALLDTGSGLCLIRQSTVNELDFGLRINGDKRRLEGIGHREICTSGSFNAKALVDDVEIGITFHIIKDADMDYPAILGRSILSQVDLIIREDGDVLTYKQKEGKETRVSESSILELREEFPGLCLQVEEVEGSQHDLAHLSKGDSAAIDELVRQYVPLKCVESQVEMKIVLTDDLPVYQRPRRTSYEDQKFIEKQIKTWLDEGIITTSNSNYASPILLSIVKQPKILDCLKNIFPPITEAKLKEGVLNGPDIRKLMKSKELKGALDGND